MVSATTEIEQAKDFNRTLAQARAQERKEKLAQGAQRVVNTVGTGLKATGAAMEATGAGMQVTGKATEYTGKAVKVVGGVARQGGQAVMQAGAELSGTGVGAIAGVPLAAVGGATSLAGGATQVAGTGIEAGGKALNQAGKATRKAGKNVRSVGGQVQNIANMAGNPAASLMSARNQDRQSLVQGKIPGLATAQNLLGGSFGTMSPGAIMNFGRNAARRARSAQNTGLSAALSGGAGGVGNVALEQGKKWLKRELMAILISFIPEILLIIFFAIVIIAVLAIGYSTLKEFFPFFF